MKSSVAVLLLTLMTAAAQAAAILPGFRVEKVADTEGFVTSIALRDGAVFYSITEGRVFRIDGSESTRVATVPTAAIGNAVLLGIAFREGRLLAHYVAPDLTADVIAEVDCGCPELTDLVPVAKCGTEFRFCTPLRLGSDEGWKKVPEITQRPKACSNCPIGREQIIAAKKLRDAKE